jgi:ribosomal protein S14
MTTKTCTQKYISQRTHCWTTGRRPHDPEESATQTGYSRCVHCGVEVYVGQGELSPERMQLREHLANRADMYR